MHCPNCGKETSTDQKFCRACGMNLEVVSKAVESHQSGSDSDKPASKYENSAVRQLGMILFLGIILLMIGAGVLSINKKMIHNDWVGLIGLLLVLGGPLLSAYAAISPLWRQGGKSSQATEPKGIEELESNARTLPEGLPAPPASITERTTNIMEHQPAKTLIGDRGKNTGS